MALAFNLTQDPIELKEFLEVSLRSISTFIDSNMCTLTQILLEEKRAQFHEGSIDKRSLVSRLLDGGNVDVEQLGRQLGYSLFQRHRACLIWSGSRIWIFADWRQWRMRWHISWVRQLPHRLRWPCDLMGLVPYDKSIGFKRTARYCSAFPNTTSGHRLTDRRNRRLPPISSGSLDHPEIIRAINWCAGRCYDRPGEDGVPDDPRRPCG